MVGLNPTVLDRCVLTVHLLAQALLTLFLLCASLLSLVGSVGGVGVHRDFPLLSQSRAAAIRHIYDE